MGEQGGEALVGGPFDRYGPREPGDLLTLPDRRVGVRRATVHEVAQMEMGVPTTAGVDVELRLEL